MNHRKDAIIIGDGIAGLCLACALAHKKRKVLVIGREGLSGQATEASAGILDPLLEMKAGHPLLKFGLLAAKKYFTFVKQLERKTGIPVELDRRGMLYTALSEKQKRVMKKWLSWQSKVNIPVRLLEREELLRLEPKVNPKNFGGIYYPTLARLNPRKLRQALLVYARQLGVEIRKSPYESQPLVWRHGIEGVQLGPENWETSQLVLAAGSWSGHYPVAGIRFPITPAKGQIVILQSKILLRPMVHGFSGTYILPIRKSRFLIGSTVEFSGFHSLTTQQGVNEILKRAYQLVPALKGSKLVDSWAGLRPYSEDGFPIIGKTSIPGFFAATGYYRSGILISPLAAELLAQGMISGQMPGLLDAFSPLRFEKGLKGT